jgi:hypothetical protein
MSDPGLVKEENQTRARFSVQGDFSTDVLVRRGEVVL